ncbi:hypothetical protein LPA44_13005 [Halobacterium sp. KA-4]|uniref:hypothetical protein n=1 Tax=Halobacterium sp. KA-4 TaxID=2896367 RepID=UPI001E378D76|nr:hypothetical protein [Halobacterium sp. KA-4]MCD2200808.1 hypothetical protein [Halobacterium sp. KA-4]
MTEENNETQEGVLTLPQRMIERIVEDIRHDIQEGKQKTAEIIPAAFILFVEKWLGFWVTLIGLTFTIGSLGMGLTYAAEKGATIPALANNISWFLGHIWTVGLLVVLTYGVILFSLLLVSTVRLVLWGRTIYRKFWNQNTPPFSTETTEAGSKQWPPTNQQREEAWKHAKDHLGNGSILFITITFLLLLFEQLAAETLNNLLSSSWLTVVGNSIDVGIGVLDFDSILGAAAPNASQYGIVLFVLFFVLPSAVVAIGTRNLLYLVESSIRDHIEKGRNGSLRSKSTALLAFFFLYSIGICTNILIQLP